MYNNERNKKKKSELKNKTKILNVFPQRGKLFTFKVLTLPKTTFTLLKSLENSGQYMSIIHCKITERGTQTCASTYLYVNNNNTTYNSNTTCVCVCEYIGHIIKCKL